MHELETDLNEWIETGNGPQDVDDYDAVPLDDVEPADRDQASRLLRKLGRLQSDLRQIHDLADAEERRIEAWRLDRITGVEKQIAHVTGLLEGFGRAVKDREHVSTLNLPNGVIRIRPPRPSVEVVDEAKFVAWAREHAPHLLNPPKEPTPAKAEIKKFGNEGPVEHKTDDEVVKMLVSPDGEPMPGVKLVVGTRDGVTITPSRQGER